MRYDLQHVSLDIPLALVDHSTYDFSNEATGVSVEISWELIDEDADPAEVVDPMVEQAHDAFGSGVEVVSSARIELLGQPAKRVDLRARLDGKDTGVWMVASGKRPAALLLKFSAPARTAAEERTFDHILRSIAPAADAWVRKGAPGFVRRQAGRITLEVPQGLSIPVEYRFESADSSLRLLLTYAERLEPRPDFGKLIYLEDSSAEHLEVVGEKSMPSSTGAGAGTEARWEIERRRGKEVLARHFVRRLALQLRSNLAFHLTGLGSESGIRGLDAAWPQLTGTLGKGA
jgi:hypothetical protein